jgi:hypothetical protein
MAGLDRYFPDRRESIALRSPCFAQALGDRPWSPVRRMRRTLGGCGKNVLFFSVLQKRTDKEFIMN